MKKSEITALVSIQANERKLKKAIERSIKKDDGLNDFETFVDYSMGGLEAEGIDLKKDKEIIDYLLHTAYNGFDHKKELAKAFMEYMKNNLLTGLSANLEFLISPFNSDEITKRVGKEKGKPIKNGITSFKAQYNSTRFVYYVNGKIISAIQIMNKDDIAIISNVFTEEGHRKMGHARDLLKAAKKKFPNLKHSEGLTDLGKKWKESVEKNNAK